MKKTLSLFVACLYSMVWAVTVFASFDNPAVTDEAGYLMQSEAEELSEELDEIRNRFDFEVAIYTESDLTSDTAEASADDIYDYNGYGAGENDDGIMLYICSGTREYHFTTHGKGLDYFNSNGLAYLESKVIPHLAEDDYYEAFCAYIDTAEELLEMATAGMPYNEKQYSTKYLIFVILMCLLVPLLIAKIKMNGKLKKMKTAVENDYAESYMKQGSMNLNFSRDIFLYSQLTKTEKPKSNSGSHTSSSGRTHGGSGGSF